MNPIPLTASFHLAIVSLPGSIDPDEDPVRSRADERLGQAERGWT